MSFNGNAASFEYHHLYNKPRLIKSFKSLWCEVWYSSLKGRGDANYRAVRTFQVHRSLTLKTESCHDADFVATDGNGVDLWGENDICSSVSVCYIHIFSPAHMPYKWCFLDSVAIEVSTSMPITMTSQWARWRLKLPAPRLFTQSFIQAQIKENIKAPRHWPLCGDFTGHRWIRRTNGQ